MNSKIFLICIMLTGFVLAEDSETTESSEKLENTDVPNPDLSAKEGENVMETSTAGSLVNAADIKTFDNTKDLPSEEPTPASSGEDTPEKKLDANKLETTTNPYSEEINPAESKKETSDNSIEKPAGSNLLDTLNNAVNSTEDVTTPASSGDTTDESSKKEPNSMKLNNNNPPNEETTPPASGEEISDDNSKKLDTTIPPNEDTSPTVNGEETTVEPVMKVPDLKPVINSNPPNTTDLKTSLNTSDIDKKPKELLTSIGYGKEKPLADHKMTPIEQKAYVCGLANCNLCPMTVDVEMNVSYAESGANAHCKDLAATMGYKGFCVVLQKTDPNTGDPIYTRTCAYYDDVQRSKCSTNFLTSQPQTNISQVGFNCENGISKYIPTSCVGRHKMLDLP